MRRQKGSQMKHQGSWNVPVDVLCISSHKGTEDLRGDEFYSLGFTAPPIHEPAVHYNQVHNRMAAGTILT